jgi:hypothetical protein
MSIYLQITLQIKKDLTTNIMYDINQVIFQVYLLTLLFTFNNKSMHTFIILIDYKSYFKNIFIVVKLFYNINYYDFYQSKIIYFLV